MYLSNRKGNQDQQDKMYSLLSLKPVATLRSLLATSWNLSKYLELQSMSKQGKEYSLLDLRSDTASIKSGKYQLEPAFSQAS